MKEQMNKTVIFADVIGIIQDDIRGSHLILAGRGGYKSELQSKGSCTNLNRFNMI